MLRVNNFTCPLDDSCDFHYLLGRNGGHLSPAGCLGFARNSTSTSKEDAVKQVLLERHCAESIVDFIRVNGLESTVDLVSRGRIDLFFTDEDAKRAKEDLDQAKEAGVDISKIEWIEKADMKEVRPDVVARGVELIYLLSEVWCKLCRRIYSSP